MTFVTLRHSVSAVNIFVALKFTSLTTSVEFVFDWRSVICTNKFLWALYFHCCLVHPKRPGKFPPVQTDSPGFGSIDLISNRCRWIEWIGVILFQAEILRNGIFEFSNRSYAFCPKYRIIGLN
jgi:hypothetical protein